MKFPFLIKEGFAGFKRARLAAVITVITITLALALLGLFGVVVHSLAGEFDRAYNRVSLDVFIDPSLNGADIAGLKQSLEAIDGVESVYYVSPDDALESFQQDFGEDLLSALGENPLPPSFRVMLNGGISPLASIEPIVKQIESLKSVDEVVFQKQIVRLLNRYFNIAIAIVLVIGGAIFFIAVILVYNTIRLTIHSRKTVVEIMRLVGATDFFIKAPFVIEGILQGFLGGLLACGLLWLAGDVVKSTFYPGLSLPLIFFGLLLFTGTLLGWIGSAVSVGKYLRI